MTISKEQIQAAIHAIDGGSVYVDLPNNGGVDVRKTIRTVLQDRLETPAPLGVTKAEVVEMLEKLSSFSSVSGICDEAAKNVSWDFVGYNEGKLRRLLEAASK